MRHYDSAQWMAAIWFTVNVFISREFNSHQNNTDNEDKRGYLRRYDEAIDATQKAHRWSVY